MTAESKSPDRSVIAWFVLTAACLTISGLIEPLGVPSPQLLTGLVVGAGLALAGVVRGELSAKVPAISQGLLGVLMGTYLQASVLGQVFGSALPLTLVTLGTVVLSIAVAIPLARFGRIGLATAVLGTLAGGSAAVVSTARELGADSRLVAFMQYTRVAMVAITAPLLVQFVFGGSASVAAGVDDPPWWSIVGRGDQLAGVSIAIVLAVSGRWLGQRLHLPSAALLGPMLLAAVVTATAFSHGFAPTGVFRELLFTLIGLEVGLRFSRETIREVWRLVPAVLITILGLSAVIAVVACAIAPAIGVSAVDAYLATTPGGINAVLAYATSGGADVALISSVQTIRLFLMLAALPLIKFWLGRRGASPGTY